MSAEALDALASGLNGVLSTPLLRDEPLAKHTTLRIGGPAALFASPATVAELSAALRLLDEAGYPWTVLGRGSNVLAADEGYAGCVLTLGAGMRGFELCEDQRGIRAGGGCLLARLVQECSAASLSGLEFAAGIPGTVAAAAVGNAGTAEGDMAAYVRTVTLLSPKDGLVLLQNEDITWEYRASSLPGGGRVVVEVELALRRAQAATVSRKVAAALNRRRATQPLSVPNAGSVFKNPEGQVAARLIEEAGLRGARSGGAQIAEMHANFIINRAGASAHDFVALMRMAQEKVEAERGIRLEAEIRFLGSFASY
jgi:UDP-N-acetylmuramate dehydrogenase